MTPQLESNQLMDGWMMMVMNNNIIIKSVTPIAQASCCGGDNDVMAKETEVIITIEQGEKH